MAAAHARVNGRQLRKWFSLIRSSACVMFVYLDDDKSAVFNFAFTRAGELNFCRVYYYYVYFKI